MLSAMKNIVIVILILGQFGCSLIDGEFEAHDAQVNTGNAGFFTNEQFIAALQRKLDTNNVKEVFGYIFSNLDSEIIVYPTENYYYFCFFAQGKEFKGNFGLFADNRDEGKLNFSYEEVNGQDELDHDLVNCSATFTALDSIFVTKIDPFEYSVRYLDKTVVFKLNKLRIGPPENVKFLADEIFIGPSFDESGLKFGLVYNKSEHHMFWILHEDDFVPETFTRYTDSILIGRRTAFAFYDDKENDRRILIGVKAENVFQNNYYDGPFDQLPDNYVYTGQIEIKKYIEASFSYAKGNVDKFGNFLEDKETRVSISPYLIYSSKDQLARVVSVLKKSSRSKSKFYCGITRERLAPDLM